MKLPKLLKQPELPENLPLHAKWLAGEGAGSWFVFYPLDENVLVKRFSPKGVLECENHYKIDADLKMNFQMGYPSHCSVITIVFNNKKYRFDSIG